MESLIVFYFLKKLEDFLEIPNRTKKQTPLPFEHSRKTKSFLTSFGVQKVHKHISQQQYTHTHGQRHDGSIRVRTGRCCGRRCEAKKFERRNKEKKKHYNNTKR